MAWVRWRSVTAPLMVTQPGRGPHAGMADGYLPFPQIGITLLP